MSFASSYFSVLNIKNSEEYLCLFQIHSKEIMLNFFQFNIMLILGRDRCSNCCSAMIRQLLEMKVMALDSKQFLKLS